MAVLNGAIHYEDIVAGSRVQTARVAFDEMPINKPLGKRTAPVSPGALRSLSLLATQKRQAISAVSNETELGIMVATQAQDGTRKYKVINGAMQARRIQRVKDDDMRMGSVNQASRIVKVLTGVGAYGIGYNPQPTTPEAKPIRKYPRDWHGENMH